MNDREMSDRGRLQAQARQETAQALRAAGAQFGEAQGKSFENGPSPSESQGE